MKKIIALLLVVVLCCSMFAACGKTESAAPAAPAAPAQDTSTNLGDTPDAIAPDADVVANADEYPEIHLIVNDYNVANSGPGQATQMACDYITEASGGKITFDVYLGGTLCEAGDSFSGTATGLADITYYMSGLTSGVQTVGEMFTQVYHRAMPQVTGITEIIRKTFEEVPAFQDELQKQGLYCLTAYSTPHSYMAFGSEKGMNVRTPADLKGIIIQASSAYLIESYNDYGITSLAMGPADWYSNLERGVCDALVLNMPCYSDFGMMELIKSYVWFGEREAGGGYSSGAATYLMNYEKWSSLPENVQALIVEGFTKAADWCVERDLATETELIKSEFSTKPVNYITDEECEAFYELALNTISKWKVAAANAGYDGEAIFAQYNAIIDEYWANNAE